MPSWRESLCRHYGLCSHPVKLFKRRVNSIHQIVWNCEEISKTIWLPNVCVLFVRWDTLVSVLLACGGPALLLCGSSHQGTLLICPHFSCFAHEITAQSRRTKKAYKGPGKLAQNFVFLWHPRPFPPLHQICVSHINFCHEWRNTSEGQEATIRI